MEGGLNKVEETTLGRGERMAMNLNSFGGVYI